MRGLAAARSAGGDLSDPALQPLQARAARQGRRRCRPVRHHGQLEGALNANRFESSGKAGFAGKVPTIDAKASFDSLDLNKLLAPEQPLAGPKTRQRGAGRYADRIRRPALGRRPLQSLAAGRFIYRHYRVTDATIEAELDAGLLRTDAARRAHLGWPHHRQRQRRGRRPAHRRQARCRRRRYQRPAGRRRRQGSARRQGSCRRRYPQQRRQRRRDALESGRQGIAAVARRRDQGHQPRALVAPGQGSVVAAAGCGQQGRPRRRRPIFPN